MGKGIIAGVPAPDSYTKEETNELLENKASLDESGKVSAEQLPEMDYISTDEKGAASGVATLGADGKVPTGQLPEISAVTIYEATIGTSWTEDSDTGVKYQTVSIDGITASNTAKIDHSSASVDGTSDGYAKFVEEENQYLTYITNGFAETVAGGIKFTIFGDPNTVNIPIVVEVV